MAKNLNVQVDEGLWRGVRVSAAAEGTTVREWVQRALAKEVLLPLEKPTEGEPANATS